MKKKAGFTLIELISVVVILGIVAVVAAPKFLNIQTSARAATIEGIANAMEGVVNQVSAKAYVNGLTPSTSNPGNQQDYILDFGIGTVEVDWGALCPESEGESGDALTMLDFMTLSTTDDLTTAIGNRHTVIGFEHSFSATELNSSNITTLPQGCYVIYDSFGGRSSGTCPAEGCVCTVRVENTNC
ncbi:type II secretion system protein [Vibrio neptunius]|uniref:type II secretion system protein n=1 Tax=Vibrio neptunius TaxID=170651 RepID=UPI0019D06EC4|nr:type II secretion system protein [Vibrio neptunius]MBN3574061.1 type II secretion system protein [Vibrio neptunius]